MTSKVYLVSAVVVSLTLAGCSSKSTVTNPAPSSNSSTSTSTSVATSAVSISGFAFSPASITVKAGTTVTWTNNDPFTHNVVGDSAPSGFGSSNFGNGQTYSFTFDTPGTYTYLCSIHPQMTGTVVVE